MEIVIAVIIGLILCWALLFFLNKRKEKPIPKEDFQRFKNQANQILIEKKEAADKEITQAHQEKIAQLERELQGRRNDYQTQVQQLDRQIQEKTLTFSEINNALKDSLAKEEKRQEYYKKKNDEWYQKETKEYQKKIEGEKNKLDQDYKDKEKALNEDFLAYCAEIDLKKEKIKEELRVYEAQQKSVIDRFKKDEEVREKQNFYRVQVSESDKADIVKLKNLALTFGKPQVIYKLIYEVYYKANLEAMFKRVLGDKASSGGIYKITNINSNKVYVGRTVSFLNRFRQHAKRGCNIDRINGLLYDEMMEQGLENFTWEILEVCPKEEQNAREKYWISFYSSSEYGYNQNSGG